MPKWAPVQEILKGVDLVVELINNIDIIPSINRINRKLISSLKSLIRICLSLQYWILKIICKINLIVIIENKKLKNKVQQPNKP